MSSHSIEILTVAGVGSPDFRFVGLPTPTGTGASRRSQLNGRQKKNCLSDSFKHDNSFVHVLLVDDHTLMRAGIRSLLEGISFVKVVAEAADGREALTMAMVQRPDVVMIVRAMRGHDSLETTAQLREQLPNVRVVILSSHAAEEFILQAMKNGVSGYLLQRSAPSELKAALHEVMRGKMYFSPAIPKRIIDFCLMRMRERTGSDFDLSPRQRQILRLIAESRSTKEIALDLSLSAKTVEFHRARLMRRLRIKDVPGLVRYALRAGLVPMEN